MTVDPNAWLLASRFDTRTARSKAVEIELERLLEEHADGGADPQIIGHEELLLLGALVEPLLRDTPEASQAAEAAFVLTGFCLAELRVLSLSSAAGGDLSGVRLASDRTVGDHLCAQSLAPRNVPATKGPFQSSSFRSGYLAEHVRSSSLGDFVRWMEAPARTLDDVEAFATNLAFSFGKAAVQIEPWPEVVSSRFSFVAFRKIRDELLGQGSGGAFEQYLVAGLLSEEVVQSGTGLRVTTKSVNANDRSTGAAGDIQIRQGQALVRAIEVSGAEWRSKLHQLPDLAKSGVTEVTIAAAGVAGVVTGRELEAEVGPLGDRLGIDPSVVDLYSFMDVLASRITPHGRAEALRFVHSQLVRFHRRQPILIGRLLAALKNGGVVAR
jgi:hypothetical protein